MSEENKNINEGKVKNVIAVVSGKGGVGKSLVTSLLASRMQKEGYKTGILDADITGPSIPKMFGLKEILKGDGKYMFPAQAKNGTKVVSLNLLLEDEEEPVIWRGPIISNIVRQFWEETNWGELDYLFVDMPPGTGDVALTVFQTLPIKGIVVVTSAQELVSMIVQKALNMALKMNIPILGLVENFSYATCPKCDEKIYLFGQGKTELAAEKNNLKVLENIPIDPKISELADKGEIYNYESELFKDAKSFLLS